jgi:hypothetical protein
MSELENKDLESYEVFKEIFKEEISEDGTIIKVKFVYCRRPITEGSKASKKKYYEDHKDKVIKKNNEYIKERRKTDHEFNERLKQLRRESYQRSKEKKALQMSETKE